MSWRRGYGWLATTAVLLATVGSIDLPANADEKIRTSKACSRGVCKVEGSREGTRRSAENDNDRTPATSRTNSSESAREARELAAIDQAFEDWAKAMDAHRQCLTQFDPIGDAVVCGMAPRPRDVSIPTGISRRGTTPIITPAQAGAIAAARLQLPTVAPGIGPSPELNPWKMAAIGYPLWLWPEGPTQVGPVSDSVGGLTVSLTAKVSDVAFRMGDGRTVTCPAASEPWTKAVEPGQKSPTCGYAYESPSLPRGHYTVAAIATWKVTWTANNQSGVITVPAVQTTQLPVGELQVLVR